VVVVAAVGKALQTQEAVLAAVVVLVLQECF
jgi:hypothetical protein